MDAKISCDASKNGYRSVHPEGESRGAAPRKELNYALKALVRMKEEAATRSRRQSQTQTTSPNHFDRVHECRSER